MDEFANTFTTDAWTFSLKSRAILKVLIRQGEI
jgi:hypothetical protein